MKLAALIIAGTRTINVGLAGGIIEMAIEKLGWEPQVEIFGGAPGPDEAGKRWAMENHIAVHVEYAKWSIYGKAAGPLRNMRMAAAAAAEAHRHGLPSGLLALWDGQSKGTSDMIDTGRRTGLLVRVVTLTGGVPDMSLGDPTTPA